MRSVAVKEPDKIIEDLLDELAAIEHARWAKWQRYVHSRGRKLSDGSLRIPSELVDRWERQIRTPFGELSESEKESDREQVRTYLPVIKDAFRRRSD